MLDRKRISAPGTILPSVGFQDQVLRRFRSHLARLLPKAVADMSEQAAAEAQKERSYSGSGRNQTNNSSTVAVNAGAKLMQK